MKPSPSSACNSGGRMTSRSSSSGSSTPSSRCDWRSRAPLGYLASGALSIRPPSRRLRISSPRGPMNFPKDWRVLIAGGGAALAAGLAIAVVIMSTSRAPSGPPPAAQGSGLVVVSGRDDDKKLDPSRPLRCFVNGQFVGEMPLAVCAQRNGVAAGALDVGLDQAGALAASNGVGADITPLPPPQQAERAPPPATVEAPPAQAASGDQQVASADEPAGASAAGDCWRYGPGGWRQLPAPLTLRACAQTLFAGRCQGRNQALYGRWQDQTLRLTDGRVEISSDDRDFEVLVDAWPGCAGGAD